MQHASASGAAPPAADAAPDPGASFNSLPRELQARITALVPHPSLRAALRLSCPAACAAVSAGVHTLCLRDCSSDSAVVAVPTLAARCGQWRGLRRLELAAVTSDLAHELKVLLEACARHCPQLSALLLSFGAFQHKVIAPPLLAALPAALPRTITRLTLDAGGYGGQLLLSPLGQLTTLTQLRLGAPTAPGSAAWLPPSLQRLGLWAGCGPAWLDAVGPCCGDSLQALHLQMLSPPDWGNDLGERLTAALQQLTRITSVTGTTEAPPSGDSLKLALEGIPVTLRRLLLYCQVEDTVSFPCAFTKQPGQDDDVVPGLEEFAAAPYWTAEQPFPVMRNLRVLHVTLLFVMPMPDNFADHFPGLTRIVCGDICGDEAVLPAISSLTALPNLVSCSFVTGAPYHTHAFSLAEFSQLTALRDLELRSLGMSFQRFENGGGSTLPRPFAEFQGAVRAPQLTRLVLRCMIDRDEDCGEAETDAAGWPRGPDAFAAALRAASPAGERLQVVFDDEEDWQPCLLQPGDGN